MNWIEYNGIRSCDLGLIVTQMPAENRAAMRYTTNSPYGVAGDLITEESGYSNYKTSVSFNCIGKADQNDIYKWLSGSGWVTTSDAPDKRRWCYFLDEQTDARLRYVGRNYDTVTVPMICNPFKYLKDEKPISITVSGQKINVVDRGDVPSNPLFEMSSTLLSPRETITVNGKSIHIVEFESPFTPVPLIPDKLSIDCEIKYPYVVDDGVVRSSFEYGVSVETSIGPKGTEWLQLSNTGSNTVSFTSGIRDLVMYPRWRWF